MGRSLASERRRKRLNQRRWRARQTPEERAARRARDQQRCCDVLLLRSRCEVTEDGCWIWRGRVKAHFGAVRPVITAGELGEMHAATAVWVAIGGKRPTRSRFLRTKCRNSMCIAPEHLYETNQQLEKALATASDALPHQRTVSCPPQ